ncbi:MAG: serine hydrolase [Pseudomonadota bacterium]
MSDRAISALERACRAFADQPGEIAVIVESKTDPSDRVVVNASRAMPSASLIKVAIACAAAADPDLDLSTPRTIGDLDETFYCSILQAFEPGDQVSLKTLIGMMLIVSDNPATSAVLDAVGMDKVNAWLAENGLRDTTLSVSFDDASLGAPLRANLTTAEDCLRLLQLVEKVPHYGFVRHMLRNNLRNERIPKRLPDSAVIAHKTGTLNGLMHDIAIVDSPEAAYYLIVLADRLPDGHDFAGDIARFSEEIYYIMAA